MESGICPVLFFVWCIRRDRLKNLKLAAVCLSCLTMTGCSALNFSVEGLINAPKLTSEQSEIHQALIESVGSNITLKYPKNGEYRSAYVIANIDDEPTDEAMVFYEYTSNGSEEDGLRVNILDKDEKGNFDLHREGGHSEFRILHHKDNTGAEIQTSLIKTVKAHPNITVFTDHYAVEIITQHHLGIIVTRHTPGIKCFGAYVLNESTGEVDTFLSKVTIMATGGCEAVYRNTTNPLVATGDGIAMVYRAKGAVKDMEFIQFHPTALFHPGDRPSFLITEAMRGYGAVLKNQSGEEFMQKYDPRLSLAPRDIVARAIDSEMKQRGEDHVYLDVTHKDPEETKKHFPNIYKKCLSLGIDITKDYIPVAPAAHYLCGGIKVDLDGQSSINRLYAIGECSCTGLHGGNRLASNSLIEAVVYADAAAKHALSVLDRYDYNEDIPEWNDDGTMNNEERVLITQSMKEVNQIMEAYVGIVRSNTRLIRAWNRLDILYEETERLFKRCKASRELCELRNMINIGYLITRQAMERKESRGLHYTIDYPHANAENK